MWKFLGRKLKLIAENEPNMAIMPIIFFIMGILTYFALPFEPPLIALCFITAILLIAQMRCSSKYIRFGLIILPLFLISGLTVCSIHTHITKTRFAEKPLTQVRITGEVLAVESGLNTIRLTITPKSISQNTKKGRKQVEITNLNRIQLTLTDPTQIIRRGDTVHGFVPKLMPPLLPATTTDQNRARSLFYDGIEATGTLFHVKVTPKHTTTAFSISTVVDKIREAISQKIDKSFSDENKGIVKALVLGNTRFVTTSSRLMYRDLGLSHILAVSGFHIGLIATVVFLFIRLIFSLFPTKISPVTVKRGAALIALCVSGIYVVISGAHIPAVRAFMMTGFVLIAIFLEKQPLSFRSLFIAAFLILCYKPHLLMTISFQLSFMAVMCLIGIARKMPHLSHKKSRLVSFIGGVCLFVLFNLSVTLATAPFIAYTFHQLPLYSVIGNLLLTSLFACAIIPLLFIGVLLSATGLDTLFFSLADMLLTGVRFVGMPIVMLPHATIQIPAFSAYGLFFWALGITGFLIFKTRIKYLFVGFLLMLPLSFLTVSKPIALIAHGGRFIGICAPNISYETESYQYRQTHQHWITYCGWNPKIKPLENAVSPLRIENNLKHKKIVVQNTENNQALAFSYDKIDQYQSLAFYLSDDNKLSVQRGCAYDSARPWGSFCPSITHRTKS